MNIKSFPLYVMAFIGLSFINVPANAAVVDILSGPTTYNVSPGTASPLGRSTDPSDPLPIGSTGSIDFRCPTGGCARNSAFSIVFGYLPVNSMLTISYTSPTISQSDVRGVGSYASYDYNINRDQFNGVYHTGNGNILTNSHFINGNPSSTALVLTSAQLGMNGSPLGENIYQNLSQSNAFFEAFFSTNLANLSAGSGFTANYSVSAVPLPGALPLFGLGLASLMGYKRFKTKRG